jgi:hypothetical protein
MGLLATLSLGEYLKCVQPIMLDLSVTDYPAVVDPQSVNSGRSLSERVVESCGSVCVRFSSVLNSLHIIINLSSDHKNYGVLSWANPS